MANNILVPALMDGDKVIVPQSRLGRDVGYRTVTINSMPSGIALKAAEYQKFKPPTLAELRHAFFDKNPDGSFVSPGYRLSVRSKRGYGEWTSTFLRDGVEAVERPEQVHYDQKRGLWIAEGGKASRVELPSNGWTTEYDKPTGFPSRTSGNREDAERIFGEDTSYFYANKNGLRAVLRYFYLDVTGSFAVGANCVPDARDPLVGVRSLRRP